MTALLTALAIATAPTGDARPAPAPDVDVTARQAVPKVWSQVAACESNRRWHLNSGNGYSGGLQFTPETWDAFRPDHYPDDAWRATALQQVQVAVRVLEVQGPSAWPVCSQKAGLR